MIDPILEIQGAILTRLLASPEVTRLVGQRIYQVVPRGASGQPTADFPYLSFGPSDLTGDDADCVTAFEFSIQIDAWARDGGMPQGRAISQAVRTALHDYDLPLVDNALVLLEHRQTRGLRDPDGKTYHAVIEITGVVEQP
ncbi:MAG: DUF3168 domain-containing protein [Xanthobacteraceae bacterium]